LNFWFGFTVFTVFRLLTDFVCLYTFELVPFDWGNQLLSKLELDFILPEGRNNIDRLGHFLVGVFAYPVVEISLRKKWVANKGVAFVFAVFALGFWAAS
jgi:putative membrane protein